jgi:hypothetical protein
MRVIAGERLGSNPDVSSVASHQDLGGMLIVGNHVVAQYN